MAVEKIVIQVDSEYILKTVVINIKRASHPVVVVDRTGKVLKEVKP